MGSVYKRGRKYYIRFKDSDGKWVSRQASTNQKDAQQLLKEVERSVANMPTARATGEDSAEAVKLADVLPGWLERRRQRGIRNVENDRVDVEKHMLPQLGDLELINIRVRHIRACVEAWQRTELAPRTVRRMYGTMHKLFADLVVDEVIPHSPCVLTKDQLPKNRDRDLAWRKGALFNRDEVELLISSDSIPLDRRVLYGIFFFTGARLGEAAGLLWSDVDDAAAPLKRLSISRSYNGDTKTQTPREVPVHPVLASILAEWKLSGFAAMLGRHPGKDDLLIPSRTGVMRSRNQIRGKFLDDLARLGLRPRRVHDTRRTFITLARVDGARKDVLEPITHSGRGGIMDVYTSLP